MPRRFMDREGESLGRLSHDARLPADLLAPAKVAAKALSDSLPDPIPLARHSTLFLTGNAPREQLGIVRQCSRTFHTTATTERSI